MHGRYTVSYTHLDVYKRQIVARLNGRQIKDMIDVRRMIEEFSIPLAIKNLDFYPNILQKMQEVTEYFTDNELSDYTVFANLDTDVYKRQDPVLLCLFCDQLQPVPFLLQRILLCRQLLPVLWHQQVDVYKRQALPRKP